MLALTYQNTYR